jgi:AcrR family transcriptional regulator
MAKNSKDLILLEAFKLFAVKSYEQVTYNDFEKNMDLTRGTILYHFKSKDILFKEVVDKYVFGEHSVTNYLRHYPGVSLKEFLELYVSGVTNNKVLFASYGLENMNRSLLNIENQAIHYYPGVLELAVKWQEKESAVWVNILQNAIIKGEIKANVNVLLLSRIFQNIYYGTSYSGIILPGGIDVEILKEEFAFIYNAIKNQ